MRVGRPAQWVRYSADLPSHGAGSSAECWPSIVLFEKLDIILVRCG
jgi:hypothetical protein